MKKPTLADYLSKYFELPVKLGMRPVIILDTSAVISLEQAYRQEYSFPCAYTFLDTISECSKVPAQLVVPNPIRKEIVQHGQCLLGGRPEISPITIHKIDELPTDPALDQFKKNQAHCQQIDSVRYFLRWFYLSGMTGKKLDLDTISHEDWSVIDTAMAYGIMGHQLFTENERSGQLRRFTSAPKAAVLSGDKHIYWTIEEALKNPEIAELAEFTKAINIRDYKLTPEKHD